MKLSKKGMFDFASLNKLVIAFCVAAVVLVVVFLIVAESKVQDEAITGIECNATSGSEGCNASIEVQEALDTIPTWFPIIVIVVIGAMLIGLVGIFKRR